MNKLTLKSDDDQMCALNNAFRLMVCELYEMWKIAISFTCYAGSQSIECSNLRQQTLKHVHVHLTRAIFFRIKSLTTKELEAAEKFQ